MSFKCKQDNISHQDALFWRKLLYTYSQVFVEMHNNNVKHHALDVSSETFFLEVIMWNAPWSHPSQMRLFSWDLSLNMNCFVGLSWYNEYMSCFFGQYAWIQYPHLVNIALASSGNIHQIRVLNSCILTSKPWHISSILHSDRSPQYIMK